MSFYEDLGRYVWCSSVPCWTNNKNQTVSQVYIDLSYPVPCSVCRRGLKRETERTLNVLLFSTCPDVKRTLLNRQWREKCQASKKSVITDLSALWVELSSPTAAAPFIKPVHRVYHRRPEVGNRAEVFSKWVWIGACSGHRGILCVYINQLWLHGFIYLYLTC